MKIDRKKNASRNIIYGVGFRIFQTIVPFLIRTVMIYFMGMEYVGLNTLFTSILQVLNLAELGVGNAMVYSMYKPIADDDKSKIQKLMNLYKRYYRIIGTIILLAGLVIIPILPQLIKDDVPEGINLNVIYIITLLTTVLSYWLFSFRTSLLVAHQRNDVHTKIQLIVFAIQYTLQIVSLSVFRNYYIFLLIALVAQLLNNILVMIVTNRMYPNYMPEGVLELGERKKINRKIRDLFTAKLGGTVTNSADTVVISAFLGLTILAKYNNYYYILMALFGFMTIIFQSCLAGIGNSLVVESPEKNYEDFNVFSSILLWIIGLTTAFLLNLYQPFMKMWVGPENMLDDSYIIILCIYFYVHEMPMIWATYKDAGGIWHEDRFRPLCVTIVNLGLNLLTVQFWGLYGVILSTVISYLVVGMPWMLVNIFKYLFHKNPIKYLLKTIYIVLISIVACAVPYFISNLLNLSGIQEFVFRFCVVLALSNAILLIGYLPLKEFQKIQNYVVSILLGFVKNKY